MPLVSVVEPLPTALVVRIRFCISDLEKKIKELNKYVTVQKKELSKTKKALDEASVEIDRLKLIIHRNVMTYSAEKARLTTESIKLSELTEHTIWGVTAKQHHVHSQLCWAHGRISELKSSATSSIMWHGFKGSSCHPRENF